MLLNPATILHGHGGRPLLRPAPFLIPAKPSAPPRPATSAPIPVRAMKKLQGRVVCTANDKTVAVEVVRLSPHPKYKRRIRIKKKYQAHDPGNQFQLGDFVQLEKIRPISKTKTFLAVPYVASNAPRSREAVPASLRDIPPELLQEEQQPQQVDDDGDAAQLEEEETEE